MPHGVLSILSSRVGLSSAPTSGQCLSWLVGSRPRVAASLALPRRGNARSADFLAADISRGGPYALENPNVPFPEALPEPRVSRPDPSRPRPVSASPAGGTAFAQPRIQILLARAATGSEENLLSGQRMP